MSWLALTALFKYLCNGSIAIINSLIFTAEIDCRRQKRRQIMTSNVDPRDESVNIFELYVPQLQARLTLPVRWPTLDSQNLTSIDVRFWRLKSIPVLKEKDICNGRTPIT